jgi:hypothetical protein
MFYLTPLSTSINLILYFNYTNNKINIKIIFCPMASVIALTTHNAEDGIPPKPVQRSTGTRAGVLTENRHGK